MDIFTTALTNVARNPIKRNKLKVNALKKEPDTHKLTDDADHLEDHDLYFIDDKEQNNHESASEINKCLGLQTLESSSEGMVKGIVPSNAVITDKQEILHPKKAKKPSSKDDDNKKLDLFV